MGYPTLSKINRGTIQLLPIDVLDKICRELHCGVGDLIEYVEEGK
ncbi:MAG: helix-turn-helix transcriptional regulator [Prevotellaceae bacterium]|nr:helix-turn-helix transcriptional regulator [Candidatus Faecinaster equi]